MPTKIDYVDETVNPLGWGCYGPEGTAAHPKPCPYCYARRFARRHLVECPECRAFVPHWHPERLAELYPLSGRPKRFFVQDMGDLFHPAVPSERIQVVFDACALKPTLPMPPMHTHLFLSKCPGNMMAEYYRWRRDHEDWAMYQEWWLGTTITEGSDLRRFMRLPPAQIGIMGRWISFEPLLGYIDFSCWMSEIKYHADWAVIGKETGTGAAPYDPRWVGYLIEQLHKAGLLVFVKGELAQQFPVQEMPAGWS